MHCCVYIHVDVIKRRQGQLGLQISIRGNNNPSTSTNSRWSQSRLLMSTTHVLICTTRSQTWTTRRMKLRLAIYSRASLTHRMRLRSTPIRTSTSPPWINTANRRRAAKIHWRKHASVPRLLGTDILHTSLLLTETSKIMYQFTVYTKSRASASAVLLILDMPLQRSTRVGLSQAER